MASEDEWVRDARRWCFECGCFLDRCEPADEASAVRDREGVFLSLLGPRDRDPAALRQHAT